MNAKHTPGPWRIEGYSKLISGEVIGHTISHGVNGYGDGPDGYVCTTSGTTEADAHLIAAAPRLLEELQRLVAIAESGLFRDRAELSIATLAAYDDARELIKSATGETT
jgi:hypothetical protein